ARRASLRCTVIASQERSARPSQAERNRSLAIPFRGCSASFSRFIGNSVGKAHSDHMSARLRVLATLACAFAFALVVAPAARADAMRCGTRLVSDGDTQSAVRSLCGEPTDVQSRTIMRRPYYNFRGDFIYYGDGLVEVPVEVWTYNF